MKEQVRVLQVVDYLNHNSGVASVVLNYFFHIDLEQVQMDFLLYENPDDDIEHAIREKGANIFIVGKPNGKSFYSFSKNVRRFFTEHQSEYDIVHVHIPIASFWILRHAKSNGVEHRIIHSHNSRGADSIIKRARNYFLSQVGMTYANHYFACSELAADFLYGKKGEKRENTMIIYNAINTRVFQKDDELRESMRQQLKIGNDILLGHVGRFSKQKNQKMLIDILRELKHQGVCTKLLLVGDGEMRDSIISYAQQCGVYEDIILCGIVTEVFKYLNAIDIFLMPSLYEGLPLSCVEAQLAGVPCVISSNITKEVKISQHLYFGNINQVEEWVNIIRGIITRGKAEKERITTEKFDIFKQSIRLQEIYKSF